VNVFREQEREFATADRIQFTASLKELGIANRELGTIQHIEDGRMTVLMDGKEKRTVTFDPATVRQYDHGYAVTSHSSQGLTAGRVIAHFDTEGPRSLVNSRLAYVAISRASEDARIYTNDVERLGRRLATDISKTAAIDLSPQSTRSDTQRAVTAFRENDPVTGTAILKEQGQVHVYASSEHRLASVALAYASEHDRAVVLAPDVRERQELTSLIRDELRQQGRLSTESHALPVWVEQHLDNPRLAANYSPRDKIHYKMGSPAEHGIADNSDVTVLSVDAKANRLTEVTYNPALLRRQTDQSSIYREEQREISEGERVQFTATVQQSQLRAGDFATVEKIRDDDALSIRTDHGKSVALSEEQARMIEYGYAVDRMPRRGIDRLIVTGEAAQLAQHRSDLAQVSGQTRDLSIYTSNDFGLAQEKSLNKTAPQVSIDNSVSLPTPDISIPGYGLGR
jgi:hypothetical protein